LDVRERFLVLELWYIEGAGDHAVTAANAVILVQFSGFVNDRSLLSFKKGVGKAGRLAGRFVAVETLPFNKPPLALIALSDHMATNPGPGIRIQFHRGIPLICILRRFDGQVIPRLAGCLTAPAANAFANVYQNAIGHLCTSYFRSDLIYFAQIIKLLGSLETPLISST
jgi:hypothetical protein